MSKKKALGPSLHKRTVRKLVALLAALAATLCLAAGALLWAQKPLQFNVVYVCNGEHVVVQGCALGQAANPANDCLVRRPDTPRLPNGRVQLTAILHSALVKTIQSCTTAGNANASTLGSGVPSGPGLWNQLLSMIGTGIGMLINFVLVVGVLGLVGWWAYN